MRINLYSRIFSLTNSSSFQVARIGANPIMESLLSDLLTWRDTSKQFQDI